MRGCIPMGAPRACNYASDCAAGQICTRDGECRPPCLQPYDCQVINPFMTCVRNACVLVCEAGRADCDALPGNGCEVDVTTSTDHCGGCNARCAARTNARTTCAAGACNYTCEASFADCLLLSEYVRTGKGDLAGALKSYATADKMKFTDVRLYLNAGGVNLKAKKPRDAAKSYARAIAEYPDVAEGYLGAGIAARADNKKADAKKYFEKFLALSPNASQADRVRAWLKSL